MYICAYVNNKLKRFKLDNVKLDINVSEFKEIAGNVLDREAKSLNFIYRGYVLNDEQCLSWYEIDDTSEIYIQEKNVKPISESTVSISADDVQQVVSRFKVLTKYPGFRSNVQRVVKSGAINDLQKSVPNICNDITAVSILLDPELLIHLADADTVRLLCENHPTLVCGASVLAKLLHEQIHSIHQQPTTSTGYSYSLDALSDDDEMDTNSESRYPNSISSSSSSNSSFNAITSAQLAAAIESATNSSLNNSGNQSSIGNPTNIITNEMFSSALQQAFGTPPVTPDDMEETSLNPLLFRFDQELKQMHELGLVNDQINIRALQATSGSLEEAVELVLSGMLE